MIIIPDMEMPKNCDQCPFFVTFHVKKMGVCVAHNPKNGIDEKREAKNLVPEWCPLKELRQCKDCKHQDPDETVTAGTTLCLEFMDVVPIHGFCHWGDWEEK